MNVELVGSRYRMSLVKKRFATGDSEHTHNRSPWTLAVYPLHFQSVPPSCFQRNVFVFKAPSTDLRTIQLIFKIFFLSVSISIPVILILFCSWPIIELG